MTTTDEPNEQAVDQQEGQSFAQKAFADIV
jgi:hypothetical protein